MSPALRSGAFLSNIFLYYNVNTGVKNSPGNLLREPCQAFLCLIYMGIFINHLYILKIMIFINWILGVIYVKMYFTKLYNIYRNMEI